ncbi:MAG: CapA family protein [Nanoarchaeota archaeon]|nr:CapA family protein [Nanoarchaeota archaeon]
MVRAGADLVIGHHPHVAQEVEKYKNGWIAYSLGNFVFDQDFSEETMRGAMARVLIRDKKIFSFKLIPIRLNDAFQPYVVE